MKNNYFLTSLSLFLLLFLSNCKKNTTKSLAKITGTQIQITDSIPENDNIKQFVAPYKDHIDKDLNTVLSYAPKEYSKNDGNLNSSIGNLMADLVLEQANPVFKKRSGKTIDMVLLNHGGIRAIIPKGNVTPKTAYSVMPFENNIVVAALKGSTIDSLITYLQKSKRAHPISGLQLVLNKDYAIKKVSINNKKVEKNNIYYVATSDYLFNGGDKMAFFKKSDTLYDLNYKIRNAMIDYFKKHDTIKAQIDDRFILID